MGTFVFWAPSLVIFYEIWTNLWNFSSLEGLRMTHQYQLKDAANCFDAGELLLAAHAVPDVNDELIVAIFLEKGFRRVFVFAGCELQWESFGVLLTAHLKVVEAWRDRLQPQAFTNVFKVQFQHFPHAYHQSNPVSGRLCWRVLCKSFTFLSKVRRWRLRLSCEICLCFFNGFSSASQLFHMIR